MKKLSVHFFLLLLAVMMVLPMAGCSGDKKLEEAYRTDVVSKMALIGEANDRLNEAITAFSDDCSEENRTAVLAAVTDLETTYAALRDLEPPERYVDTQTLLNEGIKAALEATAVYRTEFSEVTDDTFDDAFLERIQAGDELMKQANEKLLEGSLQCSESIEE